MKPGWMLWKERQRMEAREAARTDARERLRLVGRIQDVSWDIDVWLDRRQGETYAEVMDRLGPDPSRVALQSEYARLIRQVSLRGRLASELEEVA